MSLAIWSLAAQNVSLYSLVPGGTKCFIVPFGPWRHKMFHHTLWPLAAQNVPLYPLVPGGINSINMRPLQGRFSQYPDPGGVTCLLLFGPWRHKMFHCTLWPLAVQNVPLYYFPIGDPFPHKYLFDINISFCTFNS